MREPIARSLSPSVTPFLVAIPEKFSQESQIITKPLPRLPDRWSRFCDEICLFLRSAGLGVLVTILRGLFVKRFREPTKVAIVKNRHLALLRSTLHIIPVAIAILEVLMNLRGIYVGATFYQQNYLQFAAKAHEIIIQASLATILLSYLRYEITQGQGVPFGALLGSVQFSQVSYLWSTELWSAILSNQFHNGNKIRFIVLAFSCTLIAATAGPSSATLLIPRQDLWSLESFNLSLNGSFNQFWPQALNGDNIPTNCGTITQNSSNSDFQCPLSNFIPSLRSGFPIVGEPLPSGQLENVRSSNAKFNYVKTISSCICASSARDQYCATTPQEVFFPSMANFPPIGARGSLKGDPTSNVDSYLTIQDGYSQPYTIASCISSATNDSMNQTSIRFARLSQTRSELDKDREVISLSNMTMQQAVQIPGNHSQYRIAWVDLPYDTFQTRVPGMIIVHPQQPINSTVNVTTCTLNAGWGSSKIMQHRVEGNSLYSRITNYPTSWPAQKTVDIDAAGAVQQGIPDFANLSGSAYPERRIQVTRDWVRFLNPTLHLFPSQNSTAINSALSAFSDQPSDAYIAQFMSMWLVSALSRTGLDIAFKTTPDSAESKNFCDNCMTYKIERSIYGWSYQLDNIGTELAIIVMVAYCIFAMGHVFYAAVSGISSSAWDSVAELVALAMNSEPTVILQNTCAGIIGVKAFKARVQILETTKGHLELCFNDKQEPHNSFSKVKLNERYGRVANRKERKVD